MSTDITTDGPVSANGSTPAAATTATATASPAPTAADAIAILRRRPRNLHLAGGLGPLIIGAILFLLMLWVAPSVAPEHVVQRPVPAGVSTATSTTAPPATPPTPPTGGIGQP